MSMLKRTWLVFSILWAIAFLWNGSTKVHGIQDSDCILAFLPLTFGVLARMVGRFILTSFL